LARSSAVGATKLADQREEPIKDTRVGGSKAGLSLEQRKTRPYPDIRRVDHRFTAASPNRSFIHRAAFSDGEGQERGTEQSSPLRNYDWSDAALASNFFVGAQGEAYIWILEQVPH
jgi:hypothetical protein